MDQVPPPTLGQTRTITTWATPGCSSCGPGGGQSQPRTAARSWPVAWTLSRRIAQVQAPVNQLGQTQAPVEGGRKDQPGIGDQAGVVEGDAAGVVGVVASIGCSFSGVGFLFQNHYPRSTGAPSYRFRTPTRRPPSVNSG